MNNALTWLKIIRTYMIWLLHYPLEALTKWLLSERDRSQVHVIVYACSTLCQIALLLHYLAILWVWIGSESFADQEAGYLPWQLAIADFAGYTKYRIYIFSLYWVCTVVTTVGYGDYAGGTTLEYGVTLFLEFFGFVVFSALQVAVLQVVNLELTFESYVIEVDNRITRWLMDLENSHKEINLPNDLYETIKQDLWRSYRQDPQIIWSEDFEFYG